MSSGPAKYAGFDPREDDFEGIEPAPLHEQDAPPKRQLRTFIDLARARHLKSLGRTWAEVGEQLAKEEGRRIAYNGNTIYMAVNFAVQVERKR